MLEEVISRVNLIIAVEGSRKISKENLEFMFAKYQLSDEDKEAVLAYCKDNRIAVFQESSAPLNMAGTNAEEAETAEEATQMDTSASAQPAKKGGFFARLFKKG